MVAGGGGGGTVFVINISSCVLIAVKRKLSECALPTAQAAVRPPAKTFILLSELASSF